MAAVLLAGFASGCDKVTGGGWIVSSANPLEKATFGFSARCKTTRDGSAPVAVFYDGELQYHDQGADIRIHGEVEPDEMGQISGFTCKEVEIFADTFFPGGATLTGTYRTEPAGLRGDFVVTVTDNGEPAVVDDGDTFCITLTGAVEHVNCGPVQAGNIQVQ